VLATKYVTGSNNAPRQRIVGMCAEVEF